MYVIAGSLSEKVLYVVVIILRAFYADLVFMIKTLVFLGWNLIYGSTFSTSLRISNRRKHVTFI